MALSALLALASCCPAAPTQTATTPRSATPSSGSSSERGTGRVLRGKASFYANSLRGNPTASGEPYDPGKLTAANRSLPLGTRLRVTRVDTGKSVVVRVNDRGPFGHRGRILDLSRAAAAKLDMLDAGVVQVEAEVLE